MKLEGLEALKMTPREHEKFEKLMGEIILTVKRQMYQEIHDNMDKIPPGMQSMFLRSTAASTAITIVDSHFRAMKENLECTQGELREFKEKIRLGIEAVFEGSADFLKRDMNE